MSVHQRATFENEETWTVRELAEFLNVRPQTIDKWRMNRVSSPPYVRIGTGRGKIIYLKSAVIKWLEENALAA